MAKSVLFFVEGDRMPAPRYRVFQFLPYLQERGWHCELALLHRGKPHPIYYWRGLGSAYKFVVRSKRWFQASRAKSFDVAFVQRLAVPFSAAAEQRIQHQNPKMIFDFDDAIYQTEGQEDVPSRRKAFQKVVSIAQHIVAGSTFLASQTGAEAKTSVIPTVLDTDRYHPLAKKNGGKVVGWMGSHSNYANFGPLLPELTQMAGRGYCVRFVSDRPPPFQLPNMEYRAWSPERELADLQSFDVGLMPLLDTAWNRGKCAFKLIQYMAVGIPVIASPVGANREVVRDGENGFLAEQGEWLEKVVTLLESPKVARAMGERGRERCVQHYSVLSQIDRFETVLNQIADR
ncbi:MAG: glycosyltransferase family 4 protein [Acidobacteria bacterium]|nr:glycosyltransferase family 4 protein [Acidobacteriota bacterium]